MIILDTNVISELMREEPDEMLKPECLPYLA